MQTRSCCGIWGEKRTTPGKFRHHSDADGIDGLGEVATRYDLIQQLDPLQLKLISNARASSRLAPRFKWRSRLPGPASPWRQEQAAERQARTWAVTDAGAWAGW